MFYSQPIIFEIAILLKCLPILCAELVYEQQTEVVSATIHNLN